QRLRRPLLHRLDEQQDQRRQDAAAHQQQMNAPERIADRGAQRTISQASPARTSSVPAPTPATSASGLPISSESCVCQRRDQISWAEWASDARPARLGSATSEAMPTAATAHAQEGPRATLLSLPPEFE